MLSKYPELYGHEIVFRAGDMNMKDLEITMAVLDSVFELGLKKGHQIAQLDMMMGDVNNIPEKEK